MSSIFVKIMLFLNKYSIINTELDNIIIRLIRNRYGDYFEYDRYRYTIKFYVSESRVAKHDIQYIDLLIVLNLYKDYLDFSVDDYNIYIHTKKLFRR